MRSLTEQFNKIPYGWKDMDIAGIVLTLFKKQKIRFEMNGENIATGDLNVINYITKREYLERLVVKWRDIVNPTLLTNARNIAKNVFGRSDVPSDEDGLMLRIKDFAAAELTDNNDSIKNLLHEYASSRYPGKVVLESGKKLLEQIDRIKDIKAFYEYLESEKEALLNYEEDVQDIKKFFKNQRHIFDNALKMLDIYEGNRSYVIDPETIKLVAEIEKITKLQSPYSEIHKLPELTEQFRNRFEKLLEDEREPIRTSIKADYEIALTDLNWRYFKEKYADKVRNEFEILLERLLKTNNILEAIGMKTASDVMKQRFIQSFIDEQAQLDAENTTSVGEKPFAYIRKTKTVSVKSLFSGANQVSSKEDIDQLLDDVRIKLEAQLEENTTIQIV
jgi:adenylate cyclase class IV